jgi:hypothetical protein
VHGAVRANLAEKTVFSLDAEGISVCRGDAPEQLEAQQDSVLTPVYRSSPDGPLVVPTGAVFIRFSSQTRAADRAAELAGLGYEIMSVPAYAPHTAWVRAASGDIADALSGLDRLALLADLDNVEPQMLGRSQAR